MTIRLVTLDRKYKKMLVLSGNTSSMSSDFVCTGSWREGGGR